MSAYNDRHLVYSVSHEKLSRSLKDSYQNGQHNNRWRDAQTFLNCCGIRSAVQHYEDYSEKCWQNNQGKRTTVERSFCDNFHALDPRHGNTSINATKVVKFFERANLLHNCDSTGGSLGCVDVIIDRLQKHVIRLKLYAYLVLPNMIVCMILLLMFYLGKPATDSATSVISLEEL